MKTLAADMANLAKERTQLEASLCDTQLASQREIGKIKEESEISLEAIRQQHKEDIAAAKAEAEKLRSELVSSEVKIV